MIYNPWFEMKGIKRRRRAGGSRSHRNTPSLLKALFSTTNVHGALVTMPHKVTTAQLVDEMTTTAKIAGACNAILRRPDGSLVGDMFDGAGFVRGVERKGKRIAGARAPRHRLRRGRLRHRGVVGSFWVGGDWLVRSGHCLGRGSGRSAAATLSLAEGRHRLERSRMAMTSW